MYTVYFIDEFGHIYTNYGLTHKIGVNDDFVMKKFEKLSKAQCYAKSFIRRYPQAIASIDNDKNEKIKTYQNEIYWSWKEKHTRKWIDEDKEKKKLFYFLITGFLFTCSIFISLITYFIDIYHFNFIVRFLIILFFSILVYVKMHKL